jgi:hypothetical protein
VAIPALGSKEATVTEDRAPAAARDAPLPEPHIVPRRARGSAKATASSKDGIRATTPDLDAALDRELRSRGLVRADLEGSVLLDRWRDASSRADSEGLLELLDQARRAPISHAMLERKLRRVSSQISALSRTLNGDEVDHLENDYFELRDAVEGHGVADPERLAKRLGELEADLASRRP